MYKLIIVLLLIGAGYIGYQQYQKNRNSALEPLYELPYVVVYGTTSSNWTQKCLRELKADGFNPIFENIDQPDVKKEMFERIDEAGHPRNQVEIPMVEVNGNIMAGCQAEKIFALYNAFEK